MLLMEVAHELVCFLVKCGSILIFHDSSAVHNILVRLGDNSNQEVEQNDNDDELIEKPNKPNQIQFRILSYM